MPEIMVRAYKCERCEHVWMPRSTTEGKPTICPKCKSPYWDRPRRVDAIKAKAVIEHFKKKAGSNGE